MTILLRKFLLIIFLRPLAVSDSRTSKFCLELCPVIVCDFLSLAIDIVDSTSLIQIIASIGRLAHEGTPRLKFSEIRPGFELKFFGFLVLGRRIFDQPFWLLHWNIVVSKCCREISRTCSTETMVEVDRQAVARCTRTWLHSFNQGGYISTHSSTTSSRFRLIFFHMHPLQLWRSMYFISRVVVWAQDDARIRCSKLVTEQPLLWTSPTYERFVNSRL